MTGPIGPWLQPVWQRLTRESLPPTLLLVGAAGTGKGELARQLARRHLCSLQPPGGLDCDCSSCRLYRSGAHPDLLELTPQRAGGTIGVDLVRSAREFAASTASVAGGRALLMDADALTHSAANALLKLLEEPPPNLLAALWSSRPGLLPATVRSRLRQYPCQYPTLDEALGWFGQGRGESADAANFALLMQIGYGPIRAAELADEGVDEITAGALADLRALLLDEKEPVEIARGWSDQPELPLRLCWRLIAEAAADRGGRAPAAEMHGDFSDLQRSLTETLPLRRLCLLEQTAVRALGDYLRGGRNKAWLLTGLLLELSHSLQSQARSRVS